MWIQSVYHAISNGERSERLSYCFDHLKLGEGDNAVPLLVASSIANRSKTA